MHPVTRARFGLLASVTLLVVLLGTATVWLRRSASPAGAPADLSAVDLRRLASAEVPLDRGRTLVVVLSADCSHCLETARLIGRFDGQTYRLGLYFVILGKPEELEPFFQSIEAWPPYRLASAAEYAEFGGDDPPTIYLLSDGLVQARWAGAAFNLDVLRAALAGLP